MRKMKKFIGLFLAMVMVLSMTMTAFAEGGYKITISNNEAGHTYGAFQVFKGDLANGVLSNIVWGKGVYEDEIAAEMLETYGYESAAEVAQALEDKEIDVDTFMDIVVKHISTIHVHSTDHHNEGTYEITVDEPGYYFVKDKDNSLTGDNQSYTKFLLKIVDKNITVTPKTSKTSSEKKVYENVKPATDPKKGAAGENYNDVADYNIGDEVPFAFYSSVPDLTHYKEYTYIFEDKMSDGLTFNEDSVQVHVGNKTLSADEFSVVTSGLDCGCTFHVVIKDVKPYANEGDQIRVDFTATLNGNAVIGLDGNENQMRLKYSNNPNDNDSYGTTVWDQVVVFTYELDVTKIDGESKATLAGAEFILYRDNHGTIEYLKVDSANKVSGWTTDKDQASKLVSDSQGLFKVIGLDDGTYYLQETKAPAGFNLLVDPVKIKIKATTVNDQNWGDKPASSALTALKINIKDSVQDENGNVSKGIVSATVENNAGATLPETGGVGTTIFYILGAILVIGTGVVLITRRRMNR